MIFNFRVLYDCDCISTGLITWVSKISLFVNKYIRDITLKL